MSISKGSGQVFFWPVGNFAISRKFSPISIPEIAKTDLATFENSLTASQFFDTLWGKYWGLLKIGLVYSIINIFS